MTPALPEVLDLAVRNDELALEHDENEIEHSPSLGRPA
jgi:hypothetical protein